MSPDFPGGGETGELLRTFDWAQTALGASRTWPISLKTLARTILHAKQPMILWWGPELVQIYNDAMLESMGDKHPKGMGEPGREAWKQAWLAVGHELQKVVDEGAAIWNEDMYVPVDRNARIEDAWWTYNYSPVFDDDGQRAGILIICTETTRGVVARNQLERARREADAAREELRAAFMQAPTPIAILVGDDFVFTLANAAYERLVGRPVVGKALSEAFSEEEVSYYRPMLQAVYRTGEPVTVRAAELRLTDESGKTELSYIDVGYHAYLNADSEINGVVAFVTDVTAAVTSAQQAERRQEERATMLAREQSLRLAAEDANRLKDEFLATVSHELRTPLSAMLGWVQLMRSNALPQERFDAALETIERNARAQSKLIEDLLDVARITSTSVKLELVPTNLSSVVDAALESTRPAADARHVRLTSTLHSDVRVRGDAARLQQIATNLLSNAVKFTPAGGTVSVSLERKDAWAELVVTDTGRGIDAAFLPHVFERFRQAQGSTTRVHGGLGLGLSIVKELVSLHCGTISAESAGTDQGAIFRVRIPCVAAAQNIITPALTTAQNGGAAGPQLKGLRVLVVDDEADTREVIQSLIESGGAVVETAGSVTEALERFASFKPEVLVSDIGMPGADGYTLIREIRSRPAEAGGRTPAVALTAFAREDDRARSLVAGFETHVSKPVESTLLLAVIAALAPQRS